MRQEELDREELINTLWKCRGNVTRAANELGCTDRTIHSYAAKYSTVKDAITEAREQWSSRLADIAELALEKQLAEGRAWAIKFTLSTQGKARGYVERTQLEATGAGGGPIEHAVNLGGLTDEQLRVLAEALK